MNDFSWLNKGERDPNITDGWDPIPRQVPDGLNTHIRRTMEQIPVDLGHIANMGDFEAHEPDAKG